MGLNLEIRRKCDICGSVFIAKTVDSRYCSHRCSKKANQQKKARLIEQARLDEIRGKIPDKRDYISVSEAVAMFGIGRDTIYRLIRKGKIQSINIGQRLTRICKSDMMKSYSLRETYPEEKRALPKLYSMEPEDCYTIGQICEKYKINDSSVWAHVRKFSIPSRQIGNFVYVPKEEIDRIYSSIK